MILKNIAKICASKNWLTHITSNTRKQIRMIFLEFQSVDESEKWNAHNVEANKLWNYQERKQTNWALFLHMIVDWCFGFKIISAIDYVDEKKKICKMISFHPTTVFRCRNVLAHLYKSYIHSVLRMIGGAATVN